MVVDPPQRWPEVDERAVVEPTREVPIQVNGKLRDKVTVPAGISEIELEQIVMARDKVVAAIGGAQVAQVIHAGGGKLVNIVLRGESRPGSPAAPGVRPRSRKSRRLVAVVQRQVAAVDAVAAGE